MMNKIISTFLKILLLLEIRIRGQRIKKKHVAGETQQKSIFQRSFPIFGDHIRFYVKEPQKSRLFEYEQGRKQLIDIFSF